MSKPKRFPRRVTTNVSTATLDDIDSYSTRNGINRAEALRDLIRLGILTENHSGEGLPAPVAPPARGLLRRIFG